jgi:uncharacterized protein YcbK (DUF882 family)
MATKYSIKKDGAKKLSTHLRVSEFRDRRSTSDVVMVDMKNVKAIEALFGNLKKWYGIKPTTVHVTSGYRTAATNTAIGGAKGSRHLTGEAVDFHMYEGARPIPSIYILCALQRMGIKGVERIRDGVSVHIDTRTAQWYAYQVKTSSGYAYRTVKDWFATTWAKSAKLKKTAKA